MLFAIHILDPCKHFYFDIFNDAIILESSVSRSEGSAERPAHPLPRRTDAGLIDEWAAMDWTEPSSD